MQLFQEFINQLNEESLWEKKLILNRNEYLKVKGSTDTNIYYIKSGSLRIFFEDEFEEQTIRLGYQGNIIGALDSFITEKSSDLYIQVLKKTEIWMVSKPSFMSFVHQNEERLKMWIVILEQLIYQQLEREKDILTYSPLERYNRVLKRSPQLFQEIPLKYIASYLRMTPETLSRIKKS
ncbi:Crp/Fnr family transcriptional regulator [Sediminitomix flava]|uniref:CRP-like cAMP-binding protein n=1 Tax=Sediminitomix flava TaxID=379075 RepID=A0A315ZIF9_SEDFL|nr:Crp/Fnr family transcriptional regulator [Sediminitomix flava]PWJ44608.1 CRP-like cAMP-binding protein [Sediminitomix flava]